MITPEIMLVIAFTLLSSVIYVMYRHFTELINEMARCIDYHEENGRFVLKCEKETLNKRIDLLEQKLKDGLQSNAICCRSAIDKVNSKLSLIEKNQTGSINVVMPPLKQKAKKVNDEVNR